GGAARILALPARGSLRHLGRGRAGGDLRRPRLAQLSLRPARACGRPRGHRRPDRVRRAARGTSRGRRGAARRERRGRGRAVKEDLADLSVRFMEAVRDREVPFLEYHLGEEFTLTTGRPSVPARRREEWLLVTKSRYEIHEFSFEVMDAYDYRPVGLVRSRYRQTGSMDGERRDGVYLMTGVWVERDERAQLVSRH